MDFPPDAKIPIYGDKTYVKVLRLPKNVNFAFKNIELFADNKVKGKTNKEGGKDNLLDLNASSGVKKETSTNSNPGSRFNSTNSTGMNLNMDFLNNPPVSSRTEKTTMKSSNNLINVDSGAKPKQGNNDFGLDNVDIGEIGRKLQENSNSSNSNGFEFVSSDAQEVKPNKVPSFQSGLFEAFNNSNDAGAFSVPNSERSQKENTIPQNKSTKTSSSNKISTGPCIL
jgi:hypothetical protein